MPRHSSSSHRAGATADMSISSASSGAEEAVKPPCPGFNPNAYMKSVQNTLMTLANITPAAPQSTAYTACLPLKGLKRMYSPAPRCLYR